MRVIAGKYRSRTLRSLKGMEIRPTADRLRETLFNILAGGNPGTLDGSLWLDLFAGTGAVGIEALSRGAKLVYFVESSAKAVALIEQNLASLGITEDFKVLKLDVAGGIRSLANHATSLDFVFLDPPYSLHEYYAQTLSLLRESRVLKPGGVVIAEHEKRFDPGETCEGFKRYRKLEQGDAALSFYNAAG